jgi:hypothetical protein
VTRKSFLSSMAVLAVGICLIAVPTSAAQAAAPGPGLVAYIGPGAGLGFLGSLLAVLMVVFLGLAGLILYPVKVAIRWVRRLRATRGSATPLQAQSLLRVEQAQSLLRAEQARSLLGSDQA